jgi:adenylate cyclase
VTRSVQTHDGVIDKFVGDAVLATWGVPEKGSGDAVNALRAALSIRLALDELNQRRLAMGEFPLQIGIGVHMGRAIFGPMGNGTRVDHTVIGPAVNIASRVQDLTKRFGCDILISKEFYEEVTSECLVEDIGRTEVRGMSREIEIFKVIGANLSPGQFVIGDKILEATITERGPGVVKNSPNNLIAFDYDKQRDDEKAA